MQRGVTAVLALAALAAAGCAGSGTATPHRALGVYHATVTRPSGGSEQVWLDTRTGAFRTSVEQRTGGRLARQTTVFDGTLARTVTRRGRAAAAIDDTRGSPAFVTQVAGDAAVALVSAYARRTLPAGVWAMTVARSGSSGGAVVTARTAAGVYRLAVTRSATAAPARFALPPGPPTSVEREVPPGGAPPASTRAYWLGRTWSGRAPSFEMTDGSGGFVVQYGGVRVETAERFAGIGRPAAGGLRLADGARAALVTGPVRADGSYSLSYSPTVSPSSCAGDTLVCIGGATVFESAPLAASLTGPGTAVAVVFVGGSVVTIGGPAVTPHTARRIAAALRPV